MLLFCWQPGSILQTIQNFKVISLVFFFRFLLQGENPKKPGAPHNVRLYSIASTRYGDSFDGKTGTLCVRRAVYYDPETGKEDPSKKGVCSNFLCDSKPGDKVQLTGIVQMTSKTSRYELFEVVIILKSYVSWVN